MPVFLFLVCASGKRRFLFIFYFGFFYTQDSFAINFYKNLSSFFLNAGHFFVSFWVFVLLVDPCNLIILCAFATTVSYENYLFTKKC